MSKKSKGLGDSVEKVLKATGIDKVAKFIAGEDCGCDKRKEQLNKLWRYKTPQCLTETQYEFLKEFYTRNPNIVKSHEMKTFVEIYNHVFFYQPKQQVTSCDSCARGIVSDLFHVYDTYKDT
jgi:hypothetical protein